MKGKIKFIVIFLGIILVSVALVVTIDTIQALMFNRSPLLHKREYTCRLVSDSYIDKGILVNHYHCENVTETIFKNVKSECTVCYDK